MGPNASPSRVEETETGRLAVPGSATMHTQEQIQVANFFFTLTVSAAPGIHRRGWGSRPAENQHQRAQSRQKMLEQEPKGSV